MTPIAAPTACTPLKWPSVPLGTEPFAANVPVMTMNSPMKPFVAGSPMLASVAMMKRAA